MNIRSIFLILFVITLPSFLKAKTPFEKTLAQMDDKQALPYSFVDQYLKSAGGYDFVKFHIASIISTDHYYRLLIDQYSGSGDSLSLHTFTKYGNIIDTINLKIQWDCDEGSYNVEDFDWIDQNTFTTFTTTLDSCYTPKFVTSFKVNNYSISTNGEIHKVESSMCEARGFNSLSKYKFSKEALHNLTRPELKILRNQVFAMHGYIFKNEELHNYFSLCSWYQPSDTFTIKRLSDIEKYNISLIKDYELSLSTKSNVKIKM